MSAFVLLIFLIIWQASLCSCGVISVTDPSIGIAAAIASANKGDRVEISAGTYRNGQNCDLIIDSTKDGLSLVGVSGSQNTIIDCNGYGTRCLSVLDASVIISGISFRNGQATPAAAATRANASTVNNNNNNNNNNTSHQRINKFRNLPRKAFSSGVVVLQVQVVVTSKGEMKRYFHYQGGNNNNKFRRKTSNNTATATSPSPFSTRALDSNYSVSPSSVNYYSQNFGGCVLVANSASVGIRDVVVQGGTAMKGGGISIVNSASVVMSNITATRNGMNMAFSNDNMYGGGGFISNCSSVAISSSSFSNNNIIVGGGNGALYAAGLYVYLSGLLMTGPLAFDYNTITSTGNGYVYGGGVFIDACTAPRIKGPISINRNMISSGGLLFTVGMQLSGCSNALVVGPLAAMFNTLYVTGMGNGHCGGIELFSSPNGVLIGPMQLSKNLIVTSASSFGNAIGGGLELYSSPNVTVIGPMEISDNTITVFGKGSLFGGGVYIRNSAGCIMVGPITIRNNNLTSYRPLLTMTPPHVPLPPVNGSAQCSSVTITASSGTLSDGSWGNYAPNLRCSWLIQLPNAVDQAVAMFQVKLTRMNTEQNTDLLLLYDGATSGSQLLGKLSGTFSNIQCTAGLCPDFQLGVNTSSAVLLVLFQTNQIFEYDGFELTWTTFPVTAIHGLSNQLLTSDDDYPSIGLGGAISIVASSLVINNTVLENNLVYDHFSSHGGAIHAITSTLNISNCIFNRNTAKSIIAVGGAISGSSQTYITCTNCTFNSNTVIAYGDVCYFSAIIESMLCGTAFGGSVMLFSKSDIIINNSTFFGDKSVCACPVIDCSNYGASLASLGAGSSLTMSSTSCQQAQLTCYSMPLSCTWAGGGCVFTDSSSLFIYDSKIQDNFIAGAGMGGAVFGTGTSIITIRNTILLNNTARQGGAVAVAAYSFASLSKCSLRENSAISVGGAAAIVEQASISFVNTVFEYNTAPRASVVFSYNEDNTAMYTAKDITVITLPGSSSLMIGQINFSEYSNIWKCTWPGTVFSQDLTSEFFSLSCDRCTEGTYAIEAASSATINRTCQPCPFGSHCTGSSPTSNGLLALGGFWGNVNDQGVASFYPCPFGYCCPLQETCEHDFCQGGRIGRLCGQCPAGQGLRFFTEGCGDDNDCTDASWAGFVIVIGAVLIAIFLTFTEDTQCSEIMAVLLYFYQVLPLIKSTSWKYTVPTVIIALQSVFTIAPSSGESSKQGICIQQSMNAYQKLGIRMVLQGVVIIALIVVYFFHNFFKRILGLRKLPKVRVTQYLAGAVRLGVIAYITLVLIPLQMIQCIWMDELHAYVWWWDASIQCYQGWQIGGFVAVAILFPIPLMLIILLWKYWDSEARLKYKWQKEIWKLLTREYRHERRWWLGISLYRRFLLSVVFATIADANWRGIVIIVLCLGFVVLNIGSQPFKSSITQRAETISLIILGILSATAAPQLSQLQFGTQLGISNEMALEDFQFVLSVLPALGAILVLLRYAIGWLSRKNIPFVVGQDLGVEKWDVLELNEMQQQHMQYC